MKAMIILALALCFAVGCKNKEDREEVCRRAKQTFVSGMQEQVAALDGSNDVALAEAFRTALGKAEPRFMNFCKAASETDLDCLAHIQGRMNDPACKPVIDKVKTDLFGM